jgi:hypothetical protein
MISVEQGFISGNILCEPQWTQCRSRNCTDQENELKQPLIVRFLNDVHVT